MLYIAQPYSHAYPPIREERYQNALFALNEFQKQGIIAYSPITHWHPADVKFNRGIPREYLMAHAKIMVGLCWGLVVLDLEGWMLSDGVYEEFRWAKKDKKPTGLVDWRRLLNGEIIAKPLGDYRKGRTGALSTRSWGPEELKEKHREARANTSNRH
jgi:hypothetical protein